MNAPKPIDRVRWAVDEELLRFTQDVVRYAEDTTQSDLQGMTSALAQKIVKMVREEA